MDVMVLPRFFVKFIVLSAGIPLGPADGSAGADSGRILQIPGCAAFRSARFLLVISCPVVILFFPFHDS